MLSISLPVLVYLISGALLIWTLVIAVWRLYLSPLSIFPGPKLAALTLWYEFYYDVVKSGMYIWKIEELHKTYGPIIRINPYELHILDPEFFENIYTGASSPRDKYEWHNKSADCVSAMGFTVEHNLHRLRRGAVNPFFSKASVMKLESLMKAKSDRLCARIEGFLQSKQPINLTCAYLAYGMDIITDYAFADDYKLLEMEDFNVKWRNEILCLMRSLAIISHFPWFPRVLERLPASWQKLVSPDVSMLLEYKHRIFNQVQRVLSEKRIDVDSGRKRKTVFEELRDCETLPIQQKSALRLTDEASILVVAASETPAKVLAIVHFHLMTNPEKLERLRKELRTVMPSPRTLPPVTDLEKLPYMTACINEGLRLHNGITTRSQRISHKSLEYKEWTIPAGTPVSSIMVFIHYNPDIFPEPRAFKPERWITAKDEGKNLNRYFHPYMKGTRSCIGYNLANVEMYLLLAAVVRRFDMELFETELSDVDLERDWFIPHPRSDTQGVRAMVAEEVTE